MKMPHSLPLRLLIILPFSCLLVLATLIFTYVSYNNNRTVALQTAQTFNELISQHIESYIINMTAIMPKLVLDNAQALKNGVLSSEQPLVNTPWLLSQLRQSEQLGFVSLAFKDGRYIAASRPPLRPESLEIATNIMNREGHLQGFLPNEQDLPSQMTEDVGPYDPRQRPFMQCAIVQTDFPCWGKVYRYVDGDKYAISLSKAVTNAQGDVLAVTAVDMSLNRLSHYITSLRLNQDSVVLLFEQDGSLLASSSEALLIENRKESKRFTLSNHPNTLLRELATFAHYSPSEQVIRLNNQDFVFTLKFIQLGYGQVWQLAVLQPLDRAISVMMGKTSNTIILALLTLLAMIILGAVLAKLIAKPIENIANMALQGALNELEKAPFQNSLIPEVRGLSLSLGRLAADQRQFITNLEERVTQRTEELEKANARLLSLAQKDPLTGIANRRVFDETYARQWSLALRQQSPLALILCDVDYFKSFNDHYGHQQGDTALVQVANCILKQIQRPTDLVARYGGEEFVLVLPQTDHKGAWEIAEKIRQAVAGEQIHRDDLHDYSHITLSVGFASIIPTAGDSLDSLIGLADEQLYVAKAHGRNQSQPELMPSESENSPPH